MDENETIRCYKCGSVLKNLNKLNLYTRQYAKYQCAPHCLECISGMFMEYKGIYGNEERAFFEICRLYDIPYLKRYIPSKMDDFRNAIKTYVGDIGRGGNKARKIGFMAGDVLYDSEFGGVKDYDYDTAPPPGISKQKYYKWGRDRSFTRDEYDELDDFYNMILAANPGLNDFQKSEAMTAAKLSVKRNRAIRNDDLDTAKSITPSISKILEDARLRTKDTSQEAKAEISMGSVVSLVERKGFIHPQDYIPHYPYPRDMADKALLDIINQGRRNKGLAAWTNLPEEFRHEDAKGEFSQGDADGYYCTEDIGYDNGD